MRVRFLSMISAKNYLTAISLQLEKNDLYTNEILCILETFVTSQYSFFVVMHDPRCRSSI